MNNADSKAARAGLGMVLILGTLASLAAFARYVSARFA